MSYIQAIILGLIQGLTEFLPVSSSGHLAIFKHIFGGVFFESGITFDILLHVGTLIAVFAVYYKDIWRLIQEFAELLKDLFHRKFTVETPYRRLLLMLIVGSIPAAVFGMIIKNFVETISSDRIWIVGIFLFVTAALLFISDRVSGGEKTMKDLTVKNTLFVGMFQAVAILPGISRSGSTIVGGLLSGFKRSFAVKFSFLLSIPAILGAAVLDLADATPIPAGPAILGVIVSALSGFAAIKILLHIIKNNKFKYFGIYCAVMGLFALILALF